MADLKDIRKRISSVQNTRQITRAMKMVAAAKLRRCQEQLYHVRTYAEKHDLIIQHLLNQESDYHEFFPYTQEGKGDHLIIVMAADRGLCGGYNASIIRETKSHLHNLNNKNESYKLVLIGKKAIEGLKYFLTEDNTLTFSDNYLDFGYSQILAASIIERFHQKTIKTVKIISGTYRNILTQTIKATTFLPFEQNLSSLKNAPTYILTEPTPQKLLPIIFEHNLATQIYKLICENATCEQAARMTAMDNATRNANDMIADLQLVYNQTRQAHITSELMEIISGAQAS